MYYDSETLDAINDSVDLLEYVSSQIDMEKKGKEYFGHCPLHVDNTPSFSITPSKNRFYCFSCHRSGGIINYLARYEHLPFQKAVEKAAMLGNMDLSSMCKSETVAFLKQYKKILIGKKKEPEHEILDAAILDKYKPGPAEEWLEEGISEDVQNLFGVRIDDYSNRIIYPVYDIDGNLINIKGRTRYPNYKQIGLAKYLNYYTVSPMDYLQGLNITKGYVFAKKEIILFESVKSVMKAYQWGFKNCASVENHNLSDEQVRLIIGLRVDVVLAYDSDVNYWDENIRKSIDTLKRITNVYIVEDRGHLLGGAETKNAPADLGKEVWEELYQNKRKVV